MREIRQSGSEGGAGQTNVPFLPLSKFGSLPRESVILGGASSRMPQISATKRLSA